MKRAAPFIIGFASCALLWAFHHGRTAQALEPDIVFVHTKEDICGQDDIGLIKLTTKDVEELIE